MGESEPITEVNIYNQIYPVRSGGAPDYVRQLAGYVNEKMLEVSEHTPTVDTLKVAILAALNIADELFAAKQELAATEKVVAEKSAEMAALLDPLLDGSS